MENEFNNMSIYNGESVSNNPAEEAQKREEQRARQAKLPKFELADGEDFYIPLDKIKELSDEYLTMLKEMRGGLITANENLRSYMESVLFVSFKSTIEKIQRDGELTGVYEKTVHNEKKKLLTPGYEAYGWRKRKIRANSIMRLCKKQASIEAEMEQSAILEEINRQQGFIDSEEEEPNAVDELVVLISEEFTKPKKLGSFVDKNSRYIVWVLTEFLTKNSADKAVSLLIEKFVSERKQEKFKKRNSEYLKGILTEYLHRQKLATGNNENKEAPKEVPAAEEEKNGAASEAPLSAQNAENNVDAGEKQEAKEESAEEEPGDLDELQALEEELEEPEDGQPEEAQQLEIAVQEERKAPEPPKLALMLIPQAMPWEIKPKEAPAAEQADSESGKDVTEK